MKTHRLLQIIFFLLLVACERTENSQPLQISIVEQEFDLNSKTLTVDFKIQNNTDTTFLFLAFGNIHPAAGIPEKVFKSPDFPAGHAYFISNSEGETAIEEIHPHDWPDDWDQNREPRDRHNSYIKNMLIINPGDTLVGYSKTFGFYEFEQGQHHAKSIFYFGNNSVDFVDSTLQSELEQQYNAKIFRGFLESETVKVNYKN